MIYLDNAAMTYPKPEEVIFAAEHSIRCHGNPGRAGYPISMNAAAAVFSVREKIARLFGADNPECVVFTMNDTYALNFAMEALGLRGGRVLISCMEHNSVWRPAVKLAGEPDIFDVEMDGEGTVQNALDALLPDTRAVVMTHSANTNGRILPIREICREVKRCNPGIRVIIDAAQSAGILRTDIGEIGADAICVPAQKGLYGIMGCGAAIFAAPAALSGAPVLAAGGSGILSLERDMPEQLPERLEPGTLNVPAICALGAGVDYITDIGLGEIRRNAVRLYDHAYDKLSAINKIVLYSRPSDIGYIGSILFNVRGYGCEDVERRLADAGICVRSGYHCSALAHAKLGTAGTGGVRVSFGYNNTFAEIDTLAAVLASEF